MGNVVVIAGMNGKHEVQIQRLLKNNRQQPLWESGYPVNLGKYRSMDIRT